MVCLYMRMGRTKNDVNDVRITREDCRQCVDHMLDPFVGRQQPEREKHRFPFDAEKVPALAWTRETWNSMRDAVDLAFWHTVHTLQQRGSLCAHDDDPL